MKNKIGCTTNSYAKFSLDRALEGIVKAGLHYVELAALVYTCRHVVPEEMSEKDFIDLKTKLRDLDLEVISISGHTNLTINKGVDEIRRRIDLAVYMGAGIVNTGTGDKTSEKPTVTLVENLKAVAKYAEKKGIMVALETHGGVTGTAKRCKSLIKMIGSKNIGINYDPANVIYYQGVRPEKDIIDAPPKYLKHFHLKDKIGGKGEYNFPAIGEGSIDFVKIMEVLRIKNYQGPFSIELEFVDKNPESPEMVDEALKRSVLYIRNLGLVV